MASNPIKRRSRQSFFIGFLIALVIMAIVVMLLFSKISQLNEENEKLKVLGPKITVYTVNKDIEEGGAITADDLEPSTMQLSKDSPGISTDNYVDPSIFEITEESEVEDEEGDEENSERADSYTAKVKIPAGSVVTLSMLKQGGIDSTERIMEYGMIILPSQLKNGDYVDIRLRLANGTETVVLAKKRIEQCNEKSIWMKMNEQEILTMNSAIVDAYLATGSQLRATLYTNPLMQEAIEANYPVNSDVLASISKNPNILRDAVIDLMAKWNVASDTNSSEADLVTDRRVINNYIDGTHQTTEDKASTVDAGYSTEASDISTARGEYVSALEGSGMVGTTSGE